MNAQLSVDRDTLLSLVNESRHIPSPPGKLSPLALAGERTSPQKGRGLNFDNLRRYQPGDDVRLIDWQTTARLRSPWFRQYNEERERPVFLLIDQRLDMFFATREQTKSVAAVKAAALLAWRCWFDGDRIGSLVFNDTTMSLQPCRPPRATLNAILNDLLYYNQLLPEQYPVEPVTTVTFDRVLNRISNTIPSGAWVAILSDFHDLDKNCDALLAGLRRRCRVSAFVVQDDLHLRLPSSGTLAAIRQGHEATIALSSDLQERIKHSITTRLARQQRHLTHLGICVNHVVVTQDVVKQLQKGL